MTSQRGQEIRRRRKRAKEAKKEAVKVAIAASKK